MRVAPPVQARSCGAGPWQWIQQLLYALSCTVLAFWAGSRLVDGTVWLWLGSLALGVAVAWLAGMALGKERQVLRWDGATWAVEDDSHGHWPGELAVMLDFGSWLLVRLTPCGLGASFGSAALWLPFSGQGEGRAVWSAWRVALYAPPPSATRAAGVAPFGPGPG
jgi:hypothetical protein